MTTERTITKAVLGARDFALLTYTERGCWLGPWAPDKTGYVRLRRHGRAVLAHRHYFTAIVGPIPDGLVPDHLCRNRACVNPDHLQAVTHRENLLRGDTPAAENAAKTECVHGHPLDSANVRLRRNGSRQCRTCDRERQRSYRAQRTARRAEVES